MESELTVFSPTRIETPSTPPPPRPPPLFLKSNSERHMCLFLSSSKEEKTQIVCACVCVGPVARGTARGIIRMIFSLPPYWICAIPAPLRVSGGSYRISFSVCTNCWREPLVSTVHKCKTGVAVYVCKSIVTNTVLQRPCVED